MPFTLLSPLHLRLVSAPRRQRLVATLAELGHGARTILDVGAGDGSVGAGVAAKLGASIQGVDKLPNRRAPFPVTAVADSDLPFASSSFDVVLLSDVLHHSDAPDQMLKEALRVAKQAVVVKDHFAFGPWSERMLLLLDIVGNRPYGVAVRGDYATPEAWLARFDSCSAVVEELVWPLDVHSPAVRLFTRSELQFAARLRLGKS